MSQPCSRRSVPTRAPRLSLALGALIAASVTWFAAPASAQTLQVEVVGALSTVGGAPVADGVYPVTLRVHDQQLGGQVLFEQVEIGLPVSSGAFSVTLGSDPNNPLPLGLFANADQRWVGVQVSIEPELPRVPLRDVPRAGFAQLAGAAQGLQCTGCVGLAQLQPGLLAGYATKEQLESYGALQTDNTWTGTQQFGGLVLVGGGQGGPQCGLDVLPGTDLCVGGKPATLVVKVGSEGEMAPYAQEGQVVVRTDEGKAYVYLLGTWKPLLLGETCGNAILEPPEACDDGAANSMQPNACRPDCTLPVCGDGVLDAGEACDDGNNDNTDGCVAGCQVAACGDGFVQAGVEPCDDGNADETDGCLSTCALPSCGDGFVQAGVEQCDGADLGGQTCDTLGAGKAGTIVCNPDCQGFDTSDCKNVLPLTKVVFTALNEAHTGNLGGIAGADALCQQQAAAAGRTETFVAFLAASTRPVLKDLIPQDKWNVPVVDSKGQQRFSAWSQMFVSGADFGTPYLPTMNGTNYVDEGGSAGAEWNDADGWHGADATGNVIASATCSDWTSTGGSGQCTELDAYDVFKQENKACSLLHAVMCVSIDGGT